MNINDSQRITKLLEDSGLKKASLKEADFIVINACSVRQRVIDRIYAKAKKIPSSKKKILTGCLLKKDKENLSPFFDHILSIEDLYKWGEIINEIKKEEKRNYFEITPTWEKPTAYIPVMTGCQNFCSYCVVPYVRGPEISRDPEDIIKEAKRAIKEGYKEIWLLGQNVNSYKPSFPKLLEEIDKLEGDFWIRFTTSHPKDFSDDLLKKMKDLPKVTEYLSLPVQSGDNQVLKEMNRPYKVEEYKELIKKVKKEIPNITISTDIIVGFPGESKEAFENTSKLIKEEEFDMVYIAAFSPRKGTKAGEKEETVSQEEKKRREKIINQIVKKTALKRNERFLDKEVTFLPLKEEGDFVIGKTREYKTIKVKGKKKEGFQKAKVEEITPWGLKGIWIK